MLSEDGYSPEDCRALSAVIGRIGDRWTIMVVGLLGTGPKRFNDIRRSLEGLSQRMLTLTLRGLERDGLVVRTQYPTRPPAVEYALTERGQTLLVPVHAIAKWAWDHRDDVLASRRQYDQAPAEAVPDSGSRVHRLSGKAR
jgi:DNA-binding HxlR family transcriptional regulator